MAAGGNVLTGCISHVGITAPLMRPSPEEEGLPHLTTGVQHPVRCAHSRSLIEDSWASHRKAGQQPGERAGGWPEGCSHTSWGPPGTAALSGCPALAPERPSHSWMLQKFRRRSSDREPWTRRAALGEFPQGPARAICRLVPPALRGHCATSGALS